MEDTTGYRFETRVIHDGIMNPDWEGVFARVLNGGEISVGDSVLVLSMD